MLARVIVSCGLFLSAGLVFMIVLSGFQQAGSAQPNNTNANTTNANTTNSGTDDPASPPTIVLATTNSNSMQEDARRPFSGRDRYSEVNRIEIKNDDKLGRYLPNNKCRVQLIHDIDVPALEAGQIKQFFVKENDAVTPDTVIAQLRDDAAVNQKEVAIKNKNVAEVDAKNQNRINYAKKSLEFAKDIYVRKEKLWKGQGAINFVEFREAQYQESQAQLQLDEAFTQQKVAEEKLAVEEVNIKGANDLVERHKVRSLLQKGEVAEIFVQVGEWVNRGDKVARVIDMENLKITGRADSRTIYPEQIANRPVIVTLRLPNNQEETFNGRVVRINLENSVSDKYYFQVEVQNRKRGEFWILRPNAEVEIKVYLDQQ